MAGAPSGFLGKLTARRPLLATTVLALGMTALCIDGVRRSADPAQAGLIASFILNAAYVIGAPVVLAALAPRRPPWRILFLTLIIGAAAVFVAAAQGRFALLAAYAPPAVLTATAAGFFCFLLALAPFTSGVLRLIVPAPFAAVLGVVGAVGYLALDGLLSAPSGAAAAAAALVVGVTAGAGVGADFSKYFARGAERQSASAAAGHAAIAPTAFSVLATGALFGVQTFAMNFGAVEWTVLWSALATALLAAALGLTAVAGSLSLAPFGEQTAVDENRRRQWFAKSWRPMRRLLPVTTALAGTAIAGVLVVVAVFEAGVANPMSLALFLGVIWCAAAVAFVSLRTSVLIVAILFASALFAGYGYAVIGVSPPALSERLMALTFAAIALGQLTVSWRDAGEVWRNARDIAENAMSDGLRRFLLTLGVGACSLVVAAVSFAWPQGIEAAVYFAITSTISLALAPIMMIAMSANTSRY